MPKKAFQVQLSLAERARLRAFVSSGSAAAHTHIHLVQHEYVTLTNASGRSLTGYTTDRLLAQSAPLCTMPQ